MYAKIKQDKNKCSPLMWGLQLSKISYHVIHGTSCSLSGSKGKKRGQIPAKTVNLQYACTVYAKCDLHK